LSKQILYSVVEILVQQIQLDFIGFVTPSVEFSHWMRGDGNSSFTLDER